MPEVTIIPPDISEEERQANIRELEECMEQIILRTFGDRVKVNIVKANQQ
ncbi:MAG: hypothetical protein ACRC7N_10195 [Clostridium sp.]